MYKSIAITLFKLGNFKFFIYTNPLVFTFKVGTRRGLAASRGCLVRKDVVTTLVNSAQWQLLAWTKAWMYWLIIYLGFQIGNDSLSYLPPSVAAGKGHTFSTSFMPKVNLIISRSIVLMKIHNGGGNQLYNFYLGLFQPLQEKFTPYFIHFEE